MKYEVGKTYHWTKDDIFEFFKSNKKGVLCPLPVGSVVDVMLIDWSIHRGVRVEDVMWGDCGKSTVFAFTPQYIKAPDLAKLWGVLNTDAGNCYATFRHEKDARLFMEQHKGLRGARVVHLTEVTE